MSPKELAHTWCEVLWNTFNFGMINLIVRPEMRLRGLLGSEHAGQDGVAANMRALRGCLPDLHQHIDELVADETKAFARVSCRGTHRGELCGFAPTGRAVTFSAAVRFDTLRGRLLDVWSLADLHGLTEQLRGP
jgi:predicted ester cyclase